MADTASTPDPNAAATTDGATTTPTTDAAGDGGAAGASDAAAAATTPDAPPVEEEIAASAGDAVSVGDMKNAKSNCLPTDKKCLDKEKAEKMKAAQAKAEAEKGIYKPKEIKIQVEDSGLVCSMDGFLKMTRELVEIALLAVSL